LESAIYTVVERIDDHLQILVGDVVVSGAMPLQGNSAFRIHRFPSCAWRIADHATMGNSNRSLMPGKRRVHRPLEQVWRIAYFLGEIGIRHRQALPDPGRW
jgi:hypothetical protein